MARPSVIALLLIIVTVILSACAPDNRSRPVDTVEVKVPVAVKRNAPDELLEPIAKPPAGIFVKPSDPKATSALTPDGEADLRIFINGLISRVRAWEAFYGTD